MEPAIFYSTLVIIITTFSFKTWLRILNYKNRHADIPENVSDVYDENDYKKWMDYEMDNFKFASINRVIGFVLELVLLLSGAYVLFMNISESTSQNYHVQILVFFGIYYLITYVIGIFQSYYDTFVIEEKHGFNKSTKATFIKDKIKSLILSIIFGGGLILLMTQLYVNFGMMFYIYGWISLTGIILLANLIYVPVIVPIFNKLSPLEDGELKTEIETFMTKVGYQVKKISVMDASRRSSKLNAFFSGFGKFKNIVLFDTLIEKMSTEEIVAVLAHEVGHGKHKHVITNLIQIIVQFAVFFGLLMVILTNVVFSQAFGFETIHFGFSIILFSIMMEPLSIVLSLFTSTSSRKKEYQADKYAAENYSKKPMINALKVLARANYANLTPHPLFVKILYSHPPITDRISAINKL